MRGKWSEIPYAGEKRLPVPEGPVAGSWPTYFLKRDKKAGFLNPEGKPIDFKIRVPDESIDFAGKQLEKVKKTLDNITERKIEIAEYWVLVPPPNNGLQLSIN